MIVVYPSPKLIDQENQTITTSFGSSYQDQSTKNNSKMILTHLLRHWNGKKYSSHPSTNTTTPSEYIVLKIFSIELKYYCLSLMLYKIIDSLYVVMLTYDLCF